MTAAEVGVAAKWPSDTPAIAPAIDGGLLAGAMPPNGQSARPTWIPCAITSTSGKGGGKSVRQQRQRCKVADKAAGAPSPRNIPGGSTTYEDAISPAAALTLDASSCVLPMLTKGRGASVPPPLNLGDEIYCLTGAVRAARSSDPLQYDPVLPLVRPWHSATRTPPTAFIDETFAIALVHPVAGVVC